MENDILIQLSDVNMSWSDRKVLSDVNLTVNRGDFLAITGPNGGGKTTLLRILLRLLHPSEGAVTYFSDGQPVQNLSIGYLPQKNMIDSRFPITVSEVVEMGITNRKGRSREDINRDVKEIIELVDLTAHAGSSLGTLSGGQLQRALLGRALISRPELLVLDEPLSYLDKRFESRVYDIISSFVTRGTVVLVSHDMTTIASMATRHIIVNRTLEFCHSANHFMHYHCCDCESHNSPG